MTPAIITSVDFKEQEYANGVNEKIREPRHTIDPKLEKLFNLNEPLVLRFDGVSVLERGNFKGFPNVTLSHYAVSKFLKDQWVRPESFVDFGSGVGFNGNYASVYLGAKEIYFADLFPQAMQHALIAYQLNHGIDPNVGKVKRHDFGARVDTGMHVLDLRVGDARQTMAGEKVECAVAAPMYVPGVCEVFPQAFQIFEGLAKQMGAPLYIGHSNLALPEVFAASKLSGRKMEAWEIARVPLRLEYSDGSTTSVYQKESGRIVSDVETKLVGRGLEIGGDSSRPDYFHKLVVSRFG